jgi:exopolysaccharide biosynthesis polyprenyl glycosylphosphotransferase
VAGDKPLPDAGQQALITSEHKTVRSRSARAKTALGLLVVLSDIAMLVLAFGLGYWMRVRLPLLPIPEGQPPFSEYIPTMILQVTLMIAAIYFSRLYHQPRAVSRFDYARNMVGAVTIGAALAFGLQGLLFKNSALEIDYPRSLFFYSWLLSAVLTVTGREIHRIVQTGVRKRGVATDNLLIVGTGRIARDIAGRIQGNPSLGYNIVGVINDRVKPKGQMLGIPILGLYPDLPAIIDNYDVAQVIIALPDAKRTEIVELVTLCQRGRVDIKVYPDIFAYMAGEMSVGDLGGIPLLTVRDISLRGWKLSLKRGMDFIVALFGLIFLSPIMLLIALLIRLESAGSPFYAQIRMGLDGRPFPVIKFRSMRQDAEVDGPGWTVEGDPRVTRIGRLLRKTELDELPQLINVLIGQMSLVGPRPERPVYVRQFRAQIPRYMERHREKAGMTGWAQVNGLRGNTSIAERTSYDLWYVENWSLWLDIKIVIRTIWMVIARKNENAY